MPELPKSLQQAIEQGELTDAQLRELIGLEAKALGLLSTEEAIEHAKAHTLPRNYIADDLALLIELLPQADQV